MNNDTSSHVPCSQTSQFSPKASAFISNSLGSLNDLKDFEKIKDRIFIKLLSTDESPSMSGSLFTIPFWDLSIVFFCFLKDAAENICSANIGTATVESWNISKEQLYELALKNTREKLGVKIDLIQDILRKMIDEYENFDPDEFGSLYADLKNDMKGERIQYPMYVISNSSNYFGAATLLFTDVFKIFAEKIGSDLFVLPSSIHELIIVPATNDISHYELKKIVHEINTTEISEDEFLSDQVYIYNRKLDRILGEDASDRTRTGIAGSGGRYSIP